MQDNDNDRCDDDVVLHDGAADAAAADDDIVAEDDDDKLPHRHYHVVRLVARTPKSVQCMEIILHRSSTSLEYLLRV